MQMAFEQNLALQNQNLDVAIARSRLDAANGLRQPKVDLIGRYTRAEGGRTIDVPAGDLLNPVYRSLNESLVAQGRPAAFPAISNLAIPLLRAREQDTRLRLSAPVFTPEIFRWSDARRAGVEFATLQRSAFRRDLRLSVLSAYYACLRARSAELVLVGAAENTAEALRVSRALAAAGKATEDRVLRAEADDLGVNQELVEARRARAATIHSFNVVLHQPLDTAIEEPSVQELETLTRDLMAAPMLASPGPSGREELSALQAAVAAATAAEAAIRARSQPTLALVVEGGIQGESYRVGPGANYAQASLVGELNLWDGRQRRSELDVARVQRRKAELLFESMREQFALEARLAADELNAARAAMPAAQRRTEAASRALQLVTAREREGMANQLAFLDARQTHTTALLNFEIIRQRLFVAAARLDRALATTPLD